MFVEVKFRCRCGKVGVVEVELEERRGESGCGCCPGNGTGEWYISAWGTMEPEGWYNQYFCSTECFEKRYDRADF